MIGKLVVTTLVFPSIRMTCTKFLYKRTSAVVVKLALLVELGLLLGGPLPLLGPLLAIGVRILDLTKVAVRTLIATVFF